MLKIFLLISVLSAAASSQVQSGRVATNFAGTVAIFETAAALASDTTAPVERVLETLPGGVSVTAASPLLPFQGGVTGPRTNDNGDLRAYSF